MEVKRITEDLERHEKQILEYSFEDGVEIAVLTNGLLWWLYLPLSKGTWQQRKFFTIDIRQQTPDSAAQHFKEFLSREKISDGTALKNAQSLQASKERSQLIEKTIPSAWNQLLQVPDEKLLELLADKVESMCGHRPDPELLAEHIIAAVHSGVISKTSKPSTARPINTIRAPKSEQPNLASSRSDDAIRLGRQRGITVK